MKTTSLDRPTRVLLLCCLATGCAETAGALPETALSDRAVSADDDLWAMVPAEADLVLTADLAKLRESPWTERSFEKVAPADATPAFDQVRYMDRVVFAKLPTLADGASVLIAQGKVDREAMGKAFQASGPAERSTYRGTEMLVRGEEALAFVSKRTVLSGFLLAVRAALDCNAGTARGIESESWLAGLRREIERKESTAFPVALLYVHLQPATREVLMREMGEGGSLQDFGARVDLGGDLDAKAIGVVGTGAEARDLAARLAERVRDARPRPIVAAFGLGAVLDSLRFETKENRVYATLHVSEEERSEIARRMSIVAETLAKMRARNTKDDQGNQENAQP